VTSPASDGAGPYPLFGVVSVVSTPFDDDGRIDFASLAATVDDRLAAGVAGLLTPAVASEAAALAADERQALVRAVAERVDGRVPVIAGTAAPSQAESVATARLAAGLGCAGVLVQVPAAELRDLGALRRRLEAVAATGVEMVMLQDLDWNGPGIPVELVRELFEAVPAFRCIKIESVPAGPKYTAVLAATAGRLNVSGGWASQQLIEALDRGVHAFMPSAHHWVYVEILRRHRSGDRAGAVALFERLLPILAFCTQHIDVSIAFQKQLAVRQGIFRNARLRAPALTLDAHHRRIAAELLDRAEELHREVGWAVS
jgi:4-hydroxy-tetrahydrodipicolinate synthase